MKSKICTILAAAFIFSLQSFSQESFDSGVFSGNNPVYKDFRMSIGGGYAYRLGKVAKTGDRTIDDMSNDLKTGFSIDGDMQYFFKESWGLGLNVHYIKSTTSGIDVSIPNYGFVNLYEESQNTIFVGPAFVTRNETDAFLFVSTIGLGPLFFIDDMTADGVLIRGKATTLGMSVSLSGEYKINERIGAGLKLALVAGSTKSLTVHGQKTEFEEAMSLSSLSIGAFLSFRSW